MGGGAADILIGIKNVSLDPVLLGILPSGLGVYRSPFKDIHGSSIVYGGPHPSFTAMNQAQGVSAQYLAMFIDEIKLANQTVEARVHPAIASHAKELLIECGAANREDHVELWAETPNTNSISRELPPLNPSTFWKRLFCTRTSHRRTTLVQGRITIAVLTRRLFLFLDCAN